MAQGHLSDHLHLDITFNKYFLRTYKVLYDFTVQDPNKSLGNLTGIKATLLDFICSVSNPFPLLFLLRIWTE